MVELLLCFDANISVQDIFGRTPIAIAIQNDNYDILNVSNQYFYNCNIQMFKEYERGDFAKELNKFEEMYKFSRM